jgi:hypothetical protein
MSKRPLVIHPFLFAAFPVISLFSCNLGKLPLSEILLPALILLCLGSLLYFSLGILIRDRKKRGMVVSLFLLLFFSYEYMFGMVCLVFERTRDEAVLGIWGAILICGVYLILSTRRRLHSATVWLNIVAAFSVAVPAANIGAYEAFWGANLEKSISADSRISPPKSQTRATYPDIYYIILDGYARADVLKEVYDYDNSGFLDYLTQKGFYVAGKSKANYCRTHLSMASTLNLSYLDDLARRVGQESDDRRPLPEMVKYSKVANIVKQHGYVIALFSYYGVDMKDADIYMTPGLCLSDFQNVLISATPLPFLLDLLPNRSQYDLRRRELHYIFDKVPEMAEISFPTFVFAHLIAPHPPFVFGAYGEAVQPNRQFSGAEGSDFISLGGTTDEYIRDYKRQLIYTNKKTKEMIDRIISNSPEPPVIILQSDHGPASALDWENISNTDLSLKERMCILNAYYLPDFDHEQLYDEITPVNTFRVVFNQYFGTEYGLLRDQSYFSTMRRPYKFINVTDRINFDVYAECPE